jgi:hypothetical protein
MGADSDDRHGEAMNRSLLNQLALGVAVITTGALLATDLQAQSVGTGTDPDATLKAAVRYRSLNNGNSGARITDLVVPGSTAANLPTPPANPWGSGKCVQITYDGSGTLTTKVANVATPCSFTSSLVTVSRSVALGTVNYLELEITKNTNTTSVALNGAVLTPPGAPSGAFANFTLASPEQGPLEWSVTGINLTSGFTLTGTLAITGLNGGGDSNYLEIRVGEVPPDDTEGPVTSNLSVQPRPVLLNGPATVLATVSDADKGDNTVSSAEYSLNAGAWVLMDASDGAFDEIEEDVEADFTGTQLGRNEVCVRGSDSLGNVGGAICLEFLVTYKFTGFFTPVDMELTNSAKAGQAIPFKWRLTDYNDVPIEDPLSFGGFFSSLLACSGAEPTDAVEEEASGSSGLQYNGDGYWQFNWKTLKTYANSCYGAYVAFSTGATSPVAKVLFKK